MNRQAGFTILEVVMAMSILLVLLGMLMEASRTSSGLSSTTLSLGEIDVKSSRAIATMRSELRWCQLDTLLLTTQDGSSRLDFAIAEDYDGVNTIWSTTITYVWEPLALDLNENGAADEGQLVRIQDGRRRVLCRNVTQGGFNVTGAGFSLALSLQLFGLNRDKQVLEATTEGSVAIVNRELS